MIELLVVISVVAVLTGIYGASRGEKQSSAGGSAISVPIPTPDRSKVAETTRPAVVGTPIPADALSATQVSSDLSSPSTDRRPQVSIEELFRSYVRVFDSLRLAERAKDLPHFKQIQTEKLELVAEIFLMIQDEEAASQFKDLLKTQPESLHEALSDLKDELKKMAPSESVEPTT